MPAKINNNSDAFVAALSSDAIRAQHDEAGLPDQYLDDLRCHAAPLAAALQRHLQTATRPPLVGLNGCQGSGKSTLARFLAAMLQIGANKNCAIVSIDDFYLEKSARRQLARDVHPLLITRGVPGTHDLELANTTLDALLDPSRKVQVRVPAFDKSIDDRAPPDAWPSVAAGVDLVLLEGWCVGCPPQQEQALRDSVNALEQNEDSDGVWRRFVNDALASGYRQLFQRMDLLVVLAAQSFDNVYGWRKQQEQQLAQSLHANSDPVTQQSTLLTGQSLQHFINHFERLTRHQLNTLSATADAVIELSASHRMTAHHGTLFS